MTFFDNTVPYTGCLVCRLGGVAVQLQSHHVHLTVSKPSPSLVAIHQFLTSCLSRKLKGCHQEVATKYRTHIAQKIFSQSNRKAAEKWNSALLAKFHLKTLLTSS